MKQVFVTLYKYIRGPSRDFIYRETFNPWRSALQFAIAHKIPTLNGDHVREKYLQKKLEKFQPDIIFVAGFHRIIPNSIIGIPSKAIINLHPSLLPKYRGGTPIRWAKVQGEKISGVTAHLVTEKVDNGNILMQKRISISPAETNEDIEIKMAKAASEMIVCIEKNIKVIIKNQRKQPKLKSPYDPPLHGIYQNINWENSGERIKRLVSAMKPKSGGICFYKNKRICIWEIDFFKRKVYKKPGRIIQCHPTEGISVQCGDGVIKIKSFLKNGKILPARDALKKGFFNKKTILN